MTRRASTAGKRPETIGRELVECFRRRCHDEFIRRGIHLPWNDHERWLARRIAAEIRRARRGEP